MRNYNCGIEVCISSTLAKGFSVKTISVRGAQEHNLKNIDLDIPKNALVVFTGVSGSGKSSLVFDTVYAEAFRRFTDSSQASYYVMGSSQFAKMSRPRFRSIMGLPPALGLSQRQGVAGKISTVGTISGVSDLFRVYFAAFGDFYCRKCDIPLKAFSFSEISKKIMEEFEQKKIMLIASIAEKRKGLFKTEIEKFRELGFSKLRINGEIFDLQDEKVKITIDAKKLNTIDIIIDFLIINSEKKQRIERSIFQALEYGKGILKVEIGNKYYIFNTKSRCPQCGESSPKIDPRYFSHSSIGQCEKCEGEGSEGEGLPADLFPCKICSGTRLTPIRPIVRILRKTYEEIHLMNMNKLFDFVDTDLRNISQGDKSKEKIFSEIFRSIISINKVGLNHLILNRAGSSLSPGDLQRLRLASMISNKLSGVMYAVDEPCQGLTAEEVKKITLIFKELIKDGASILAVEHHPTFLSECEILFLMGPGAGVHGGQIVAKTTDHVHLKDLLAKQQLQKVVSKIEVPTSMPAKIKKLSKKSSKSVDSAVSLENTPNNLEKGYISFSDISLRNLKMQDITIQQGAITVLRGESGRGKSSFLDLCLLPALSAFGGKGLEEDLTRIPQYGKFSKVNSKNISVNIVGYVKPGSMTRSSRRSVASALEVIAPLREIFAKLPASQVMGLTESHFSWNSKLGRCDKCEGRGYIELPQKYAQSVRVECELCLGAKLNSRSLLPRFKGANLADIMDFTLEQTLEVFENHKHIASKVSRACQFGLGYIQLGQGMDSLSGGELQRLNLTLELKRASLEGAWFILTHPSTGLHGPDIQILGNLMKVMTERGATFVLIENREEFSKFADNIIEF